jgi:hypothetical protein
MTLRPLITLLAILALGSCEDFPTDPRSTLDRIRSEGSFRVGLVSSAVANEPGPNSKRLLMAVAKAANASPKLVHGETEVLLAALEEGRLELVIGRFEKKSPWASRVTFGPPVRVEQRGNSELLLRPAMRNGENGWIALIEREARNLGPAAQ